MGRDRNHVSKHKSKLPGVTRAGFRRAPAATRLPRAQTLRSSQKKQYFLMKSRSDAVSCSASTFGRNLDAALLLFVD